MGSKFSAGPIACPIRFDSCESPGDAIRALVGFRRLSFWRRPSRAFGDDKSDSAKAALSETVICLELPHPDRVIDRLTDPRMQEYLKLSQAYQKFASGKQLAELRAVAGVIASQLNTTWEEGLRDLTGGGILCRG